LTDTDQISASGTLDSSTQLAPLVDVFHNLWPCREPANATYAGLVSEGL
jgi:hypothetical protein